MKSFMAASAPRKFSRAFLSCKAHASRALPACSPRFAGPVDQYVAAQSSRLFSQRSCIFARLRWVFRCVAHSQPAADVEVAQTHSIRFKIARTLPGKSFSQRLTIWRKAQHLRANCEPIPCHSIHFEFAMRQIHFARLRPIHSELVLPTSGRDMRMPASDHIRIHANGNRRTLS